MATINDLTKQIIDFRDERDWKQFHNPKDMALSLVLEAAEVMEHFQWKSAEEMAEHLQNNKKDVADELADCMYWILLMAHDFNIDITTAIQQKLAETAKKYPIDKSKGSHKKYNQL